MVGVFLMFGYANVYALRVNLSVAIVVMVENHTVSKDNREIQETAEFSWSTQLQGIVLSSFYVGYMLMNIPGGYLARKCGGATMIGLSVGGTGAFTLFTPLAARIHVGLLIALRVAVGLAESSSYPAGHAFWSLWAPPLERSKLGALNFAGGNVGIIVSMFCSGYLAIYYGWPSIFYVFGACAVIWSLVWLALVRNSPSEQSWITREEVEYIEMSLAADIQEKHTSIPWKAIFSSLPFWAIVVAHFTHGWGLYTMLSELPLYSSQRLNLDLKETSVASTIPYVVTFFVMLAGAQVADYFRKHYLSTGTVRKMFNTIGFLAPAVFFLVANFTNKPEIAVTLFTLGMGLNGLIISGFAVNHLDIAPPFASILFGISDLASTLGGIISPTLTGFIVKHHTDLEWKIVFIINGVMYLLGAIFYIVFGSGEKQSWASDRKYNNLSQQDSDCE